MVDPSTSLAAAAPPVDRRDSRIDAAGEGHLGVASSVGGVREKLPLKPQVVRIEVLGDEKVGKTSLICSLVSRHFSERVPAVLLNVQIPAEENNENRLRRWLDLIARHKEVPVVLVGNKDDIKTVVTSAADGGAHATQIRQLTNAYQFAVDGGDCSARNFSQVARAFYFAQKAVLYPVEPLYNGKKRALEPNCIKAIKRTFRLFDRDRDGVLSRDELNDYQHDCFGMRLLAQEMDTMMEFLQTTIPDGVKEDGSGVRFDGFAFLWQLFIDRKRPESCWQVLRCLGYNNDLVLEIPPERIALLPHDEDQSAQLTPHAIEFLDALLRQFDADKDGSLTNEEIDDIFSICDDMVAPWKTCSAISSPVLFESAEVAEKMVLPRSSWLALWSFVAQENPVKLLETLFYLGYNDRAYPALEFTNHLKSRFAKALVEPKPAASAKPSPSTGKTIDDAGIIRAVNVVPHRDSPAYLLLTEPVVDGELEKSADVLCFLFDPQDAESLAHVEQLDTAMPESIPRVFVGLTPHDSPLAAADWEVARQVKAGAHIVEDSKAMAEAFSRLVRTAIRPPNARAGSSGGVHWLATTAALTVAIAISTSVVVMMPKKHQELLSQTLATLKEQAGRWFAKT
ncbi:hypothetical protein P43SY_003152 [Pythium insidiosum]|uniref:EF-hand domain-containing protein n=1 Tax=Pythium insidiosum TaxID=114742 RepID=A0AAD5Q5X8_PYTIN|nr:hypothetical protein P43SY_003152 [Pythium insidiosum]